ncbi:MAG TPA: transglycosylase domain-containing protein [Candidatus Deferrimicrobium sp.]|nr:transglycosylase domain-containing protein [Candidatus Deferrimicrobium sp.]
MAENPPPAGRLRRLYHRLPADIRAALDPSLSMPARLLHGAKGLALLGGLGLALMLVYGVILLPFTPSIADLRRAKIDQPSVLISADGRRLATLKPMNREWVRLNQISPHVITALIATEDHRFYNHYGVDLLRMASGILRTLIGDPQGGSTLTQQLARNLYPEGIGRQRTVTRKLKETITAIKIEFAYSKHEILETYLNTMPFLYNAFGIEMAARTYFDKPAQKLTLIESATLIAMLKGTAYYNPVLNPERSLKRRNVVLGQMVKRGVLSEAEFNRQKLRPIRLDFERQPEALGPIPHLAMQIRKWLIDWADRNDKNIYTDGLIVHTTIDSRLQALANQAVNRQMESLQAVADVEWGMSSKQLLSTEVNTYVQQRRRVQPFGYFWKTQSALFDSFIRESPAYRRALEAGTKPEAALAKLKTDKEFLGKLRAEKSRLQAGFVAIDPASGHVKAWVGSRDFRTDQFDHVVQARRQPGSTFKPFVYGAAIEQGMSPDKRFVDRAVEISLPGGKVWRPADATAPTGRSMTAREGLIFSKNTITAQVMQEIGPIKTAQLARLMGITQSKLEEVPALALGTSPVTLLEMVSAYSTLAAGGQYRPPIFVSRITDKNGNELVSFASETQRVLSDKSAGELINILRDAIDQGTGQPVRAQFGVRADVAGKTGTTQDNTDGWFILMHARLVAGSWVGFNDSRITMRSDYWGQGAHNALLLVGDFFQHTLDSQFVAAASRFPYERPYQSVWDPVIDTAKDWLGGILKDWGFGDRSTPAPAPQRRERSERDLDSTRD